MAKILQLQKQTEIANNVLFAPGELHIHSRFICFYVQDAIIKWFM